MYVLFVVLDKSEYLSEILFKIREAGIRGATVMDSMGANVISKEIYDLPVLGGLVKSIDGDTKRNKTFFSVIEKEEQVHNAMNIIEGILGGETEDSHKGIMFVLPVTHFRGGELNRHIERREKKKAIEKNKSGHNK